MKDINWIVVLLWGGKILFALAAFIALAHGKYDAVIGHVACWYVCFKEEETYDN